MVLIAKLSVKNSSVTIWQILFNIAIPIIHHKYRDGFATMRGASYNGLGMPWGWLTTGKSLWLAPRGVHRGGGLKTFHRVSFNTPKVYTHSWPITAFQKLLIEKLLIKNGNWKSKTFYLTKIYVIKDDINLMAQISSE